MNAQIFRRRVIREMSTLIDTFPSSVSETASGNRKHYCRWSQPPIQANYINQMKAVTAVVQEYATTSFINCIPFPMTNPTQANKTKKNRRVANRFDGNKPGKVDGKVGWKAASMCSEGRKDKLVD
jgi:hypothetical protein